MPTTLTVTYTVIVACVIETRTVPELTIVLVLLRPGLSSLAGNRAWVAASCGRDRRVLVRLFAIPVRQHLTPHA